MSEEDFRDGLEAALVGEPALNFDADALIERARREARRRRALVGAGLASATVVVTAVAVPTILGSPRPVLGAASDNAASCGGVPETTGWFSYGPVPESGPPLTTDLPPSASYTSAPPDSPVTTTRRIGSVSAPPPIYTSVNTCPPSPESSGPPSTPAPPQLGIDWPPTGAAPPKLAKAQVQERADALREYLRARIPVVVPGATDITVTPFADGVKGTNSDGLSHLESDVGYVRDGVTSLVWVQVSAPGQTDPTIPNQECGHGINPVCNVVDQPDGSSVVIKSEDLKNLRDGAPIAEPGARQVSATHYRRDGSQVSVTSYNIDPLAPGAVQPNVSLTTAQLVTLATDPKLTF